ncbi:trypsin-like peptidase domain-containing protein [Chitinophaga sp. XS-30]|uniref:trypsin-like peptidase domain-containing protein n=1 Tax=Chitinophaga sp. XS-30 TaxID=2604421 RepID=UPI00143D8905|nr:trypsin-like peptidase domain-containing protein [Chitinophaga sp. XS-30]
MNISSPAVPFMSLEQRQMAVREPLPPGPGTDSGNFRYAAAKCLPGVVRVFSTYPPGYRPAFGDPFLDIYNELWQHGAGPARGRASGVMLTDDGYIVTNNHVVQNAVSLEVELPDQRTYTAQVIGTDSATDLALLRISEKGLPFIRFGSRDNIAEGDWVLAIGNPLSLTSTVTAGIVSARNRNINAGEGTDGPFFFIQTDAVMNDGSSGGALVDINGRLIGINTGIITPTGAYAGYAFAIPVEVVKKVCDDLLQYGTVLRAYMGVYAGNTANARGVVLDSLVWNGPAMNAGLLPQDTIIQINDMQIRTMTGFHEAMLLQRPGENITVQVRRNGARLSLPLVPDSQKEDLALRIRNLSALLRHIGIDVTEILSQKRKDQLNIDGGLEVTRVFRGKAYWSTGMEPGFVILFVNDKPVHSKDALFRLLKSHKGKVLVSGIFPEYPSLLHHYTFSL